MRLRTKTLISVLIIVAIICATLHSLTYFVLQPSFSNLEKQETTEKVNQAKNLIDYRLSDLVVKVSDYAFWDDTYRFPQDQNIQYIESNFVESTFENLNLNLIGIVNSGRELLYCQSYDLSASCKVSTDQETAELLVSDGTLWAFECRHTRSTAGSR